MDPVRDFHELTSLARGGAASDRLLDFAANDPANAPQPFKRYAGVDLVELTTQLAPLDDAAGDVLSRPPHGDGDRRALDAAGVASLLFFAAGVTRVSVDPDGTVRHFRAAPAGGNLHGHEVYVATGEVGPIGPGLYHLRPDLHALERLRPEDARAALARIASDEAIASAPLSIVITALPWRKGWRYRERGFRHIVRDIGSLVANLLCAADALGLSSEVRLAFEDAELAGLLGVDPVREPPIAIVNLGHGERSSGRSVLPPLVVPSEPLSPVEHELPLVTAVRAAGDLDGRAAVEAFRGRAAGVGTPLPEELIARPRTEPLEDVILRRGSTRVMRRERVAREALLWPMAVATAPTAMDSVARHSTLIECSVSVHAVDGVDPGRYAWRAGQLEPVALASEPDARRLSQELCGDQALGGDAAYTVYLSFDWQDVVGELGGRGYRAALFESGVVLGRLNLAACALGLGATGLTTFDRDVPPAFGAAWTNIAACAVGVPAYRARKGGRPPHPTRIEGPARTRALLAARAEPPSGTGITPASS